jgi:chromosome segregation ATPase
MSPMSPKLRAAIALVVGMGSAVIAPAADPEPIITLQHRLEFARRELEAARTATAQATEALQAARQRVAEAERALDRVRREVQEAETRLERARAAERQASGRLEETERRLREAWQAREAATTKH